jgi:23S rRNA pseudouridine2605 synthase
MERLQKVIAQSGYCSRRKAEELILQGAVKVNGVVVKTLPVLVSKQDAILVNNEPLQKEDKEYFVLYKPKQVLSSVTDDRGRPCAVDMVSANSRIYPVGRLDYDTSGVLLLSSDGEFTQHLTHPKAGVEKEYVVRVKGHVTKDALKQMQKGMTIDDEVLRPVVVKLVEFDKAKDTSKLEMVLKEGKNRQIKRMMQAFGYTVTSLRRVRVGPVTLQGLKIGESRRLKIHEVKLLMSKK